MSSRNKTYGVILLVLFLYFLLRILNFTLLPIFNDESTYIRYGLHQLKEPNHQPYSLLIGKEPLDPFLYALVGTMMGNLLLGGRLVTLVFGLLTLLGLYLFTKSFFDKRAALFTAFFYVIAPYTVFFDRLALLDSSVSTIAVWSLYLTQLILKKKLLEVRICSWMYYGYRIMDKNIGRFLYFPSTDKLLRLFLCQR